MTITVAITGATGYVGQHLLAMLAQNETRVIALSRKPVPPSLSTTPIQWVIGDITNQNSLAALVQDVDFVIHLAAYVHQPTNTAQASAQCWQINYQATVDLITHCLNQPQPPYFILISTTAVYGPSPCLITENTPCQPITPYGQSKLAAEQYLLNQIAEKHIQGCILQPCMIYGLHAPGNLQKLIQFGQRGWLPLLGHGENYKSLVHIDHVIQAIQLICASHQKSNGQRFIITDGSPIQIKELLEVICRTSLKRVRIIKIPLWLLSPLMLFSKRLGQLINLPFDSLTNLIETYTRTDQFSNQKIVHELNFQPQATTLKLIEQTIQTIYPPHS